MPKQFVVAWNNRNATDLANLFDENAEFVNVVGLWWHNKADIFKAHDYGLKNLFSNSELSIRKVKTKFLSDDIAVVHARLHLEGQTEIKSQTPQARNTIFTFVVQKKKQGWICVSAHNTDIVPGKETNIVKQDNSIEAVDYRKR
ncbi:SgcJ/EcaC family oxidoreductase [Marivirga lumbricoides]|uniref:SgcJ/EcaC family oxidoreductase n=1 Tax=Marivirga lumbricoides TaxID=1046115 RepID=UPI00166C09D7